MEATIVDAGPTAGIAGGELSSRGPAATATNGPIHPLGAASDAHILWVGEDSRFGRSLPAYLSANSLCVTSVADGAAMLTALKTHVADLVVLALPPELERAALLAPPLREKSPVPVIILSLKQEEADRVMALELGADDYLSVPFSPRELLARVRAILRRRRFHMQQRKTHAARAYRFGDWELNVNSRRLVSVTKRQIPLTNGEFSLLLPLLAAGGRALSRMELLDLSRLHDDEVFDRAVDVLIARLRRKLEPNRAEPSYLLTVRRHGYRIGVPVEPVY